MTITILRWYRCGPCDSMWRDNPDGSACFLCGGAGESGTCPDLRGPSHYDHTTATEVA